MNTSWTCDLNSYLINKIKSFFMYSSEELLTIWKFMHLYIRKNLSLCNFLVFLTKYFRSIGFYFFVFFIVNVLSIQIQGWWRLFKWFFRGLNSLVTIIILTYFSFYFCLAFLFLLQSLGLHILLKFLYYTFSMSFFY